MLLMVWSLGQLAPLIHQLKPSIVLATTIQPKLDVAYRLATLTDAELTITPLERKWETQRLILQTDFNGFVGYINDIDRERSGPNEAKHLSSDVTCDCRGRAEPEWNSFLSTDIKKKKKKSWPWGNVAFVTGPNALSWVQEHTVSLSIILRNTVTAFSCYYKKLHHQSWEILLQIRHQTVP